MACDMGFIGDLRQAQWAVGSLEDIQHFGSSMESPSSSSSIGLTSSSSCTSTSADLADDASSSSSSSGPLCELSDLMVQLPIKRGLSKFYHGKSQTFGSLANVRSLEDLAKKETTFCSRRIKSCKSYGGDLYLQKFGPTPRIKKTRSPISHLS